jgi:hypothetical protein
MSINRATLKSLYVDTKKSQATQLINSIVNSVKSVATSGKTFYDYDITRTTFGAATARHMPGPGPRGQWRLALLPQAPGHVRALQ